MFTVVVTLHEKKECAANVLEYYVCILPVADEGYIDHMNNRNQYSSKVSHGGSAKVGIFLRQKNAC